MSSQNKLSALFLALVEKYRAKDIGTVNCEHDIDVGPVLSLEVELADESQSGEQSYPYLSLEIARNDSQVVCAVLKLCWWEGGEGCSDSVPLQLHSNTTLAEVSAWFATNKEAFEVSPAYAEVAEQSMVTLVSCAQEAMAVC